MSVVTLEILLILVLTLLNGIFAMSELAMASASKTRLQQWAETGDRNARRALNVASAPEKFLSTVQVGITLIGVLAGAFGGATVAQQLASTISRTAMLAPYAETHRPPLSRTNSRVCCRTLFLPETVQSRKLLEEFKKTGKDTALLLDEYGGLQGLITATDILKALLGEVSSSAVPGAVQQPDGSWLVDGMLPLDEMKDTLTLRHPPAGTELPSHPA
jgi:CBS domain containing-hemolysin-like protein